ncbi:MAG: DNA-binding beta-propeller fold protein YncE [Pseudohongiellaceae bacterium]|jgi:DNA-binding beta-propeller fold protein YncE
MPIISRRQFNQRLITGLSALAIAPKALAQGPDVFAIAGTGTPGTGADLAKDTVAIRTPINNPYGVVIGPDKALYFCEVDTGLIRRISLRTNKISTIAGNGGKHFEAESRNPLQAPLNAPHEIRWDDENSLYVVERDSHCVKRIDGRSGLVTTLAGNGRAGFEGDEGSAVLSQLQMPHSIAFDSKGNLLICDLGNGRLRQVSRETGLIKTIAGTGEQGETPTSGAMLGTPLRGPRTLDTDRDGNAFLVLREGNAIYQLDLDSNSMEKIAGTGNQGYSGDGGDALSATFNGPKGIAYSRADNSLYVADTENHALRKIDLGTGLIDTVLGTGEKGDGPDGRPYDCQLNRPHGVCVFERVIYVTDSENHRIRALTGVVV